MTDEQIIQAVDLCANGQEDCRKCPLYSMHSANCIKRMMNITLDLIKRQQAEIYNLKEDLSEYRNMPILTKNDCMIATVEKRADGKQYHNALLTIKVDEIRAEAYKEFAEKLKYRIFTVFGTRHYEVELTTDGFDRIVEEMTEESNGE